MPATQGEVQVIQVITLMQAMREKEKEGELQVIQVITLMQAIQVIT